MKSISYSLVSVFILAVSLQNCKNKEALEPLAEQKETDTVGTTPEATGKKLLFCEDYAVFDIGEDYYVQNNVWGFYAGSYSSPFTQCVFYDSLHPSVFGWEWKLDSTSLYPSYPRVAYGWNPWFGKPSLSRSVNSLNAVVASFDYKFTSKGAYNTSFDIFLHNTDSPTEETISAEIMIWIDADTLPAIETVEENIVIGGENYRFYKNTDWYSFPFLVFLKKEKTWNGEIDIYPFLQYLSENSHISAEDYLTIIEFGNEIWSGTGEMEIKNYMIEMKP